MEEVSVVNLVFNQTWGTEASLQIEAVTQQGTKLE